jgi:hypothetical protein
VRLIAFVWFSFFPLGRIFLRWNFFVSNVLFLLYIYRGKSAGRFSGKAERAQYNFTVGKWKVVVQLFFLLIYYFIFFPLLIYTSARLFYPFKLMGICLGGIFSDGKKNIDKMASCI